jgi:hypothetical protein
MSLVLTACADRAAAPAAVPDVANVQSVQVDYQYMGWSFAQESFTLVPAGNGSDFILLARFRKGVEAHDTGQRVPRRAVEELLAAASAPAWSRERGVRAVAAVLQHDKVLAIQPVAYPSPDACTPQQIKRVARAYVRRKGIVPLTDDHYGQGRSWTDDYPFIRLHIQFHNGPPLRMHSDSQKAMMLPWYPGAPTDPSPPESHQNWSLALSRALRGVVPSNSSAYERLGIEREWQFKAELGMIAEQECKVIRE